MKGWLFVNCGKFWCLVRPGVTNFLSKCGNCSIGAIKCKPRIIKYIPSHFSRLGILQHHYVHDHLSGTLTFYKPICFYKKSQRKTFLMSSVFRFTTQISPKLLDLKNEIWKFLKPSFSCTLDLNFHSLRTKTGLNHKQT